MTYKDRTQEFNAAAESIRVKQNNNKTQFRSTKQQKSQFMVAASQIGKDIFETTEKLNRLTKLAKNSGKTFDDPAVEIEELTFIIKQDVQSLNRQIATLRDIKANNSGSKQGTTHSDTVVTYLNNQLASTTKGFTEALHVRTENLKKQQEGRSRFIMSSVQPSASSNRTGLSNQPPQSSTNPDVVPTTPPHVLRHRRTNPLAPNDSALYRADNLPESPSRSDRDVAIAMPQMMALQPQDYYSSRTSAVESIEKTISDLQGVFQQLASLVSTQGDMIQRIDSDIENTQLHIDRGHNALLENLYKVSKNRWLIVKLFFVLIFFIVIFIVFFV